MDFHQVIYPSNLLSFCSGSYSLRSCSNKLLQVPRSKLKSYGDRRFSVVVRFFKVLIHFCKAPRTVNDIDAIKRKFIIIIIIIIIIN